MKVFKPDYYVSHFSKLPLDQLKQKGITLLLCDIDNTLVSSHEPDSNQDVSDFVKKVKAAGMQIAIVSNSKPKRAKRFSKDLHIDEVYAFSCKPYVGNIKKAMKAHGVTPAQTALIGDQLFTDVLGSNLAGITSILTKPISTKDKWMTVFNRHLEGLVFRSLKKKYGFDKEVYDDETL